MKLLYRNYFLIFINFSLLSISVNGQQVKLMSYNIGSSNWIGNRDSVIARVIYNDPDIFCAIEATGNKRPFIETNLPNYNLIQTFGSNPNITESHIFYRKNMFEVIDSGFIQVNTYGGYTGIGRYVNWTRFGVNSSQNEFIVYASHFVFVFTANPDSATIGQYRHANEMVQLMNEHSFLNIPQITVGDFNADSAKAVMQFLLHQIPITYNSTTITNPLALNDSWYIANPSTPKPGTVGSGMLAIDWILTTPNTTVINAIIDKQGVNSNGDLPSDHLPLMITFDLPNPILATDFLTNFKFNIFPNPFYSSIYIEPNFVGSEQFNMEIYNLTGELVYHGTNKGMVGTSDIVSIDCSNFDVGLYFYKIYTSHRQITGKITKNN